MSDFILVDGDVVMFLPTFGQAVVAVMPAKLAASGSAKLAGKKICLAGDEKKVEVKGCSYISGNFVIPGTGTLTIAALAPNQTAKKTKNGKPVMLKGTTFVAKFQVQSPAKQPMVPSGTIPDPIPIYMGQGSFITTNLKWKAT